MIFGPCNRALKIRKSIWDFNSQHGSSFGSVKVHSLTFFYILFLAHNLASPCLGHEPKARVAIVNALHKLRHYLLSNRFVFYVDHMALVHLINKPYVSSKLIRWLLLFMEYDFKIVYNLGKSHLIVDALNN
jgi:hypothetical protein